MKNPALLLSMRMAIVMGIFLPLAETLRRSNQLTDFSEFFSWFDDYLLGAFLLIAAYRVWKDKPNAYAWLIAAWGFVAGALFLSLLGQLRYFSTPQGDPGIFSTGLVFAVKIVIFLYMLFGMLKTIQANRELLEQTPGQPEG